MSSTKRNRFIHIFFHLPSTTRRLWTKYAGMKGLHVSSRFGWDWNINTSICVLTAGWLQMSNGCPVRDAWQHKVWSHGAQIHYPVPTSWNEPNRPFHASVEHCSWTLRTGRDGWTFAMLACSTDQMKLAPLLAGGKTNYFCHFISTHKGHETTLLSPACSPEQREMAEGKDCLFYSSFSKDCRKVTVLTSCSRAAPQLLCNSVSAVPAVLVKQWPGAGRRISCSSPALGNREVLSPIKITYGLHSIPKFSAHMNWHDSYRFMGMCQPVLGDGLKSYFFSINGKLRPVC